MSVPKVFISYSHDTQDHKKWVLDLAIRLRSGGVDAIIDQWELRPGDDLPHFMETHLSNSDFVIMVCTDAYVEKANSGTGGVGYEKMIVTADLLTNIDSNKIIPVIRQRGTHNVPTFLKTKLFINFSTNGEYEYSFDELVRTFHDSPIIEKPEIGNNPFSSTAVTKPKKSGDPLSELMKVVISDYEQGADYTRMGEVAHILGASRIMTEILISEALSLGYIRLDEDGDILLGDEGKKYAIENNLVNA